MSDTYHVSRQDMHKVADIIKATFPEYKGNTVKLVSRIPTNLSSYWDGGSRSYYALYDLAESRVFHVADNHPAFNRGAPSELNPAELPPNVVVVEHCIFCGKDMGICIYARPEMLTPLLPAASSDVTRDERIVLHATRSLKPGYGGVKENRFEDARRYTGITWERWQSAKASCIAMRLLNKAGAITTEGRNADGGSNGYPKD